MDLRSRIFGQFAKPTGVAGWVVGHLMSMKNRDRSVWVFSVLDLKPTDRVLEVGFGSGADIARASHTATFVAGVDHSDVMVRQANRRNAKAIREGRVDLRHGSVDKLPYPDTHFDKVFAINSAQFWKETTRSLAEISRVLKPGGWLALAVQPRNRGATDETTRQVAVGLRKHSRSRALKSSLRVPTDAPSGYRLRRWAASWFLGCSAASLRAILGR